MFLEMNSKALEAEVRIEKDSTFADVIAYLRRGQYYFLSEMSLSMKMSCSLF
jgi:hypothetical protein